MLTSKLFVKVLLPFMAATLFLNCNIENSQTGDTDNDNLNKLLNRYEIQLVSLDKAKGDTIEVLDKNILGQKYESLNSEKEIYSTGLSGLVVTDSIIFVADVVQNSILKMNKSGVWVDIIGKKGKGPKDFSRLTNVYSNTDYFFSYDRGNQRLNIYDKELNYIKSLNNIFQLSNSEINISNNFLLLPSRDFSDTMLVSIHQINSSFKQIEKSFLPRLIPLGMEPSLYNSYIMDTNNNGDVIIAYRSLPFIFIYDNKFKHKSTLKVESKLFTEIENPSLKPVARNQDQIFKSINLFNKIFLLDDGSILLNTFSNLYLIRKDYEKYNVVKSLSFFSTMNKQTR